MSIQENRRRLDLLAGVTVPSLLASTVKDVTWIVVLDHRDPLLAERKAVLESAGLPLELHRTPRNMTVRGALDRPRGRWATYIDWPRGRGEIVLTMRMDDDDALIPWALERVRERAQEARDERRIVWTLPCGWRVVGSKAQQTRYTIPMFSTLQVRGNDHATIFDQNHTGAARLGPIRPATEEPAWLWIRHDMTRSGKTMRADFTQAKESLSEVPASVRRLFPGVDWDLIARLPQKSRDDP